MRRIIRVHINDKLEGKARESVLDLPFTQGAALCEGETRSLPKLKMVVTDARTQSVRY